MRALLAILLAVNTALAQESGVDTCYRFSAALFVRLAWNDSTHRWRPDTTSVVQLTNLPHMSTDRMVEPGDKVVRALLPSADSVLRRSRAVAAWNSSDNEITIKWFNGGSAFVFSLRALGDSLVGHLTNHADAIDNFPPKSYSVRAVRIECPAFPPSNGHL